ncbi:MAG: hypothetical protein ACLP7Q_02145 [Isosphaeraceae bacterium]
MYRASREAVGQELPARARAYRISHRLRLLFIWAVWTVGTLSLFLHVGHYARNLPYWDDWEMVPVITGHEPVTLKWAWALHSEHHMPVPKLILAGLIRWVAPDFRTGMYLNAGLVSSAAAMMIVLAHRLRGHQRLTDVVLPLSILTLAQSEVLLIGFALNLVLTALLTFELISVLGRATERPPWRTVIPIGIVLVTLPLCGGSGLVLLPPLAFWLAGYLCWGWWSGREPGVWARGFGISALMACSAIIALYLSDYVRPPYPPSSFAPGAMVRTTLEFLSLSINSGATVYWQAASLTVLALATTTLIRLSIIAARLPHERPRAFGLAAIIISMTGLAISVGVSRSGFGPGMGLSSRYVALAAPLLSVLYITWLLYTPARAQRLLQTCILLVVCISVPFALQGARQRDRVRLQLNRRVERSLKSGISNSQFLNVACPGLHPDRKLAAEYSSMLRSSEFGDFKYLHDDQGATQLVTVPKPVTRRR